MTNDLDRTFFAATDRVERCIGNLVVHFVSVP